MNMSSSLGSGVGCAGSVGLGSVLGRRRVWAVVKVRASGNRAIAGLASRLLHLRHIDEARWCVLWSVRRSGTAILGCNIMDVE